MWSRWNCNTSGCGKKTTEGTKTYSTRSWSRCLYKRSLEVEKWVCANLLSIAIRDNLFWYWYLYRKGHRIYDQLKKLGAGVDWDRAVFMMDPVNTFSNLSCLWLTICHAWIWPLENRSVCYWSFYSNAWKRCYLPFNSIGELVLYVTLSNIRYWGFVLLVWFTI